MMICWLLLVVYLASAALVSSMLFAQMHRGFPRIADDMRRVNAGMSWLFGLLLGLTGPLGVLVAFLVTGFAQHGFLFPTPGAKQ